MKTFDKNQDGIVTEVRKDLNTYSVRQLNQLYEDGNDDQS